MGGKVTIHAPYELRDGEKADGLKVYFVDDNGKKELCETSYDNTKKRINWKTDHLSVYMIAYEENKTNQNTGGNSSTNETTQNPNTQENTLTYITYTVQRGDTLWKISRKYNLKASDIT